jgi:hypothetical protein
MERRALKTNNACQATAQKAEPAADQMELLVFTPARKPARTGTQARLANATRSVSTDSFLNDLFTSPIAPAG